MIRLTPIPELAPSAELGHRVEDLVAEMLEDDDLRRDRRRHRHLIPRRMPRGRALHIEDLSCIPRVDRVPSSEWFQLRARQRATAGEVVLSSRRPPEGYECYNTSYLGLGEVRWVIADSDETRLARLAWNDRECFDQLRELASGSIYLHPYIASDDVWELADRLSRASGEPVPVLGPPPTLCALLNDKRRFADLIVHLFGPGAAIDLWSSASLKEVGSRLHSLFQSWPLAALRMPSDTAGTGTRLFDSAEHRCLSRENVIELVREFARENEWNGREQLLVVRWEETLMSPSVQLWIPPVDEGSVICEGFFEQIFADGDGTKFKGAFPVTLPHPLAAQLTAESLAFGILLQRLGYTGRCSLDTILTGREMRTAKIRYVECNGRWGGVSSVMSYLSNIVGDYRRHPYVASAVIDPRLVGTSFKELLAILAEDLYRDTGASGRLILYNVGGLADHGRFDVICLGRDLAEAQTLLDVHLPRMLRL